MDEDQPNPFGVIPFMALDSAFSWADVSEDIRAYAIANGICGRTVPIDPRSTVYALPLACFPSRIDPKCFQLAKGLQKFVNKLIHNIATNHEFLRLHLSNSTDPFVKKLYEIYENSRKNINPVSTYQLGIFRSDYMVDIKKKLKQVEINTISVGFAGTSQQVSELHRYSVKTYQPTIKEKEIIDFMPENNSCTAIAEALIEADTHYNDYNLQSTTGILIIVQENEANIMDQKLIEWEIKKLSNFRLPVFRRTFEECDQARNLWIGESKELILKVYNKSQHTIVSQEISVVYYRTGYKWEDYSYEGSWRIRQRVEDSKAIKCPSIQYQLAGLKQIQFLLSDFDIFKRFYRKPDEILAKNLYDTFVRFYEITDRTKELVKRDPKKYVLKSNQEGGGHNFFGDDIVKKLATMSDEEKRHHFLMQFIEQDSYFTEFIIEKEPNSVLEPCDDELRGPDYELPICELQDELGIYGVILANHKNEFIFNRAAGHLLRSKPVGKNEAGIMSGSGVLNSPFLDYFPEKYD